MSSTLIAVPDQHFLWNKIGLQIAMQGLFRITKIRFKDFQLKEFRLFFKESAKVTLILIQYHHVSQASTNTFFMKLCNKLC